MNKIAIIVAVAKNGVIGSNNNLPWHLPDDLRHFKQITLNKPVIMGRKTWQSLGKPLPKRLNIVLSSQDIDNADIITCSNLNHAIDYADNWLKQQNDNLNEIMIIGGANVYQQALPLAHKIYLTKILIEAKGDTFFPDFSHLNFKNITSERHDAQNNYPAYIFEEYVL